MLHLNSNTNIHIYTEKIHFIFQYEYLQNAYFLTIITWLSELGTMYERMQSFEKGCQ
jgi:hypothetical protein